MKNKRWKKGWKVIKKRNRQSCTGAHGTSVLTYGKNEVVEKPHLGGPLAVFKTRKAARNFIKRYNKRCRATGYLDRLRVITRCEYIESKHTCLWEWKRTVWWCYGKRAYKKICAYDMLPTGTAFANKVRCLE